MKQMAEKWTSNVVDGYETMTVTGRTKVSILKKINPIWWLLNDAEPTPPAWYLPTRPQLWRIFCWYCRNPLCNFYDYVLGVVDSNYSVSGKFPVMVTDWHDHDKTGWKFTVIHIGPGLPFVSYTGKRVLWHIGWEAGGSFQIKVNLI